MTFCYDYNADRYCEKCGLEIIKQINATENIDELEITDSNDYPQKNHINDIDPGAPDHCGNCNVFLEHTLNEECKNYVLETVYCDLSMYGEIRPIVQQWIDFWEIDINQDSDIKKLLAQSRIMATVITVGKYKNGKLVDQTRRYPGFIAGHEWSIRQWFKPFRVGDETIAWIQQPNIVNRIK